MLGGTPGVAYFSNYSHVVPVLEGRRTRNFLDVMTYIMPCNEKNDENGVSWQDMATQMSPVSSPKTSPTYVPPPVGFGSQHSARLDVRDVQANDKGSIKRKQESLLGESAECKSRDVKDFTKMGVLGNSSNPKGLLAVLFKQTAIAKYPALLFKQQLTAYVQKSLKMLNGSKLSYKC
ncbi:hypothetical protein L1987_15249 [Smallanthus sonchifolius]|uniref:Uncharacterized protein n=1 Tax=Smallanthus sonchifolius TaxID=185202 RepID=A0ACB9J8K1_9ASTR|nr:hypothetical protein L1987_15249 [Smallanthus sonchifolius]